MAITDPLSITWRDVTVGGATEFAINGPYVLERAYDRFLLVFDVVTTGTDFADLKTKIDVIEEGFSTRLGANEQLIIDLDGNTWTYHTGQTIFNAESTVTKSGNPDIDRGLSRQYTVKIEGELPEGSGGGMREFQVLVSYDNARRRTVTMGGQYFASTTVDATTRYLSGFNAEATTYLNFVDSSAAWEMVEEGFTIDRNPDDKGLPRPHTCNFSRQYSEIIANQTLGDKDDPQIVDHRITFTDMSVFPVDSREDSQRLRRVAATYECGVSVETSGGLTDLSGIYEDKIKPLLRQEFVSNYAPQQFVVEDRRVTLDTTNNRISATTQFVYQSDSAGALVEVSESLLVRENRTIDYTYLHGQDEFGAFADVGFAQLERVWTRTAIAIGNEAPKYRISDQGGPGGEPIGPWTQSIANIAGPDHGGHQQPVKDDGWNIISSTSSVTPQWMGMADGERIELTVLSETIVQRWTKKPSPSTGGGGGPTTGGGGATGGGPTTGPH